MKLILRILNSVTIFSLSTLVALLVLAMIKTNSLIATFPYITFVSTVALCFYVLILLYKRMPQKKWVTVLLTLILLIPIVIHAYYFVDKNYLEQMQAFYIANLFAVINIGIMACLNLFKQNSNKITLFIFTFFTAFLMALSLIGISKVLFYDIALYLLLAFTIFIIGLSFKPIFSKN